ncbi:ATP-grasp domain-containing protein [Rossellomorea aquimaris]|uniref:ATP-grasp domain-containing protein n=1 Tax=Rossellomorea aquimaris TaxID=189382 RepID=UPI001CD397CC|nr:ATP-grasp domain-containing protein [Rossellomorea aquimaris]MCA1057190.1 ATP-grasp domain-containing protein [Rossellomorea aquimaris]
MKSIIFIETNKSGSSREAIRTAERLGYYTVLFTERINFINKREDFPDVHFMKYCDLSDMNVLIKEVKALLMKGIEATAIVSFVDPHSYMACALSDRFNINHFSTEGMKNIQNKIESRKLMKSSPITPAFWTVSTPDESKALEGEIEKKFPLIMKSPQSTGSKDVYKVANLTEYRKQFRALTKTYENQPVLIEEYLPEPQYLVEVMVVEGKVQIMAVIKQDIQYGQRFIVMGYKLLLKPGKNFFSGLKKAVEEIVSQHGLENGPCHLELRRKGLQWKLIEINARISGAGMNNMIKAAYGINLVEETLKMAMGKTPDLEPKFNKYVYMQYVTVDRKGTLEKVTGKKRAKASKGVVEVYVKPRRGQALTPPLSMGHRYAYVTAVGDTPEEAEMNAKKAASEIRFWIEEAPGENITTIIQ